MIRSACPLLLALLLTAAAPPPAQPTVDLNVRNADLSAVIDLLASQAHVNIVVDGSVAARTVTLRLLHVPLRTAIGAIESAYGLAGTWQDGVLHLGDPAVVNRTYPSGTGLDAQVFPLRNAAPASIVTTLVAALPPGTLVVPDTRTNAVLVKGSRNAVAAAKALLDKLDTPQWNSASYDVVQQSLAYVPSDTAVTALKSALTIAPPNSVTSNPHDQSVILTGTRDFVAQARGVLFDLDRPGKQVMIAVRVVDVTPINNSSNVGLLFGGVSDTGTETAGTNSTIIAGAPPGTTQGPTSTASGGAIIRALTSATLNLTINALVSKGNASILAQPKLVAMNNEKATLNIGESYPIVYYDAQLGIQQVQFVQVGVQLAFTPTIGTNGDVLADVNVGYSQILSFVQNYPIIGQRTVQTIMRVQSDQSIVISGLFEDVTSTTIEKIPWLSDIPIIGKIFQNRATSHTRDEIVFLLSPHIITTGDLRPALAEPTGAPCALSTATPC